MSIEIAILADDLTGALDAAAPYADRGLDTRVATTPESLRAIGTPIPTVLSVCTQSRHVPPDRAISRIEATSRMVSEYHPAFWFKKIDSTLRGNVAPEILAAIAATGLGQAVICSAMPEQGRTLENGAVLVDGIPLADTDFVHDAVSPASPVPLCDQLRRIDPALPVANIAHHLPAPTSGSAIWVADAQNRGDLARIAKWLIERHGQTMAVGSAGLAEALAATAMGKKADFQRPGRSEHPLLYVIGSRSTKSDRQVERLLRENSDCVEIAAPQGRFDPIAAARDLSGRSCGVVRIPRQLDDPPADTVAAALSASVAALLDIFKFRALLLTGGDVTAAVLHAIDEPIMTLEGQISPGVPLSHVEYGGERLWLVTKAGGFGNEDLLLNIPPLLGR